jgi:hypothetical protein
MQFSISIHILAVVASALASAGSVMAQTPRGITTSTEQEVRGRYRKLIEAENAHDIEAVRRFVWNSSSTLFVAKTKTPAEGNWAGFWGVDTVVGHINELFHSGTFVMAPDYSREKIVQLSPDVTETYVPLQISVAYAGQTGTPKPFLMIVEWVKDEGEWKMATDIALPIPPAPIPSAPILSQRRNR